MIKGLIHFGITERKNEVSCFGAYFVYYSLILGENLRLKTCGFLLF